MVRNRYDNKVSVQRTGWFEKDLNNQMISTQRGAIVYQKAYIDRRFCGDCTRDFTRKVGHTELSMSHSRHLDEHQYDNQNQRNDERELDGRLSALTTTPHAMSDVILDNTESKSDPMASFP